MALVFLRFFKPKLDSISQTQDTGTASTIGLLRSQQAELIKERDTCTARFERATILYDVGLFNNETRAWVIPADVEPVLAPNKNGSYSHYDPKTKIETVHFKRKAQ
jgi:hypothetical protein